MKTFFTVNGQFPSGESKPPSMENPSPQVSFITSTSWAPFGRVAIFLNVAGTTTLSPSNGVLSSNNSELHTESPGGEGEDVNHFKSCLPALLSTTHHHKSWRPNRVTWKLYDIPSSSSPPSHHNLSPIRNSTSLSWASSPCPSQQPWHWVI